MMNWLKNRLSPNKNKSERWLELSEALEQTWEDQFSVPFDAVATLRSIYTADEAGQRRKLAEYGKRYEKYLDTNYLGVTLAMRKLEMLQKDTALPSELMVLRVLGSAALNPIRPLYALSEQTYGSHFYTEEQLTQMGIAIEYGPVTVRQVDGTWKLKTPAEITLGRSLPYLTSRVALVVDLSELEYPPNTEQLIEDFNYIKPLHIVLNGIMYQMFMQMSVQTRHYYSMFFEKKLTQYYPGNLLLNGSWKLGTNINHTAHSLNGGWKLNGNMVLGAYQTSGTVHQTIGERKIFSSGKATKTIELADNYVHARLGESLLRLDRTWKIGSNRILTLAGRHSMVKSLEINARPVSEIVHAWESEIPYPGSPAKLVQQIALNGLRQIDGTWKLGDTEIPAKKLSSATPWKLRSVGIQCDTAASVTMAGTVGMMPKRIMAGSTKFESRKLRLNGRWHIGGKHKLDSTWKLNSGVTLSAPKITDQENGSGWELTTAPNKLGTGWKLGSSYGPTTEVWIDIRKAA